MVSLTATGGLHARRHAAEPDATPYKAWRIVRVLSGVGHQRLCSRGNYRLAEHAPAGIRLKPHPESFGGGNITGLRGRFVYSSPTGDNDRNVG